MKYGWELWFLLFTPGDNEGVSSGCTKFPQHFEDDWDDAAETEKDKEVAEIFDKKLADEVSRLSTLGVLTTKRLAGWEAFTMMSYLQETQRYVFPPSK